MQQTLEDSFQWLRGFAKEVAVASTLHEPKQSLLQGVERITPFFKDIGLDWHLSATAGTRNEQPTSELFWKLLSNFDAQTDADLGQIFQQYNPQTDFIEANHIKALLRAARSGKHWVMYMDLDRITVGANYFHQEFSENLRAGLDLAKQGNVVTFARSPMAINTHLSSLVLTEGLIHPSYNRALSMGGNFVDLLSTAYIVPSDKLENLLSGYQGGEFLGARSHYPHSKIMLAIMKEHGMGLSSIQTDHALRYEAAEQMRGEGQINLGKHEWTRNHYENVTLASRPLQEAIMQNPKEWKGRFTTVDQYLNVLDKLWLQPQGTNYQDLNKIREEVGALLQANPKAEDYRAKAIELSKQYKSY